MNNMAKCCLCGVNLGPGIDEIFTCGECTPQFEIDLDAPVVPSDLDVLQDMFDRAGIEFEVQTSSGDNLTITDLTVERGYIGFVTQFTFDGNGKLIEMGAYE